MKRSQMVLEIAKIIPRTTVEIQQPHLAWAHGILIKLEELGMLPPATIIQPLNVQDNAWDPE